MRKLHLLFLLFIPVIGVSQTTVNPDVSVIGTFNIFTNNVKHTPEYGKLNFDTPGMELFVEGYLNPYARAAIDVAFHEGEFHAEEIYAHIVRGLPLDVQLKAGKYLVGFGKINTIHPHAWSFIYRPLYHQVYFGDEGFNDIGFDLSFILPTEEVYTTLDLGIFKGDVLSANHEHEHEEEHESEEEDHHEVDRGNSPIFAGRLSSFFSLGDFSNLEVGLSGSYGVHSKGHFNFTGDSTAEHTEKPLYFRYGGIDLKFKYRPDSYTAITLQGEAVWNHRDVLRESEIGINVHKEIEEQINTFGAFVYADYRFNRIFSIGAKYDFTYGIAGEELSFNSLANDDINKTHGIEGWFGYYPIEETLVARIGVQHLMFS
ncbi:MAG: hypothetical protein HKM87_05325, partial [Ignavibacteriaceae bacterium]|nr:hypothetical protein [Ignavibacteriaceae bacterium]